MEVPSKAYKFSGAGPILGRAIETYTTPPMIKSTEMDASKIRILRNLGMTGWVYG
jgi:hypothetical protein